MYIDDEPEDEIENEDEEEIENVEGDEKLEEPATEPEISDALKIVQAAMNGDAVGVKDIFKAAVTDRVADLVAGRKETIANSLITPDQEESEEQPEESENEKTETDNPADNVSTDQPG